MKKISICVPCYNEEGNIERMYATLTDIMSKIDKYDYEIIFEDNASIDNTQNILRRIAKKDKKVKVIINNRNFGPMANSAYIVYQATGDAVIGLPCDFQEPPEMIPDFIKYWSEGYKVVLGKKISSQENGIMYLLRTIYYKIIKIFSAIDQYEHVTGFGVFDIEVIKMIESINDPEPNFRNIVAELGYDVKLLPYNQKSRTSGKSGYSLISYLNLAIDSFMNTSTYIIRLITIVGSFFTALSIIAMISIFILDLFNIIRPVIIIEYLVLLIVIICSIILLALGIVGEYINSVLFRIKQRPLVVEKERINFNENENI